MTTLYERRTAAVRILGDLMFERVRAGDELGADITRQLLAEARARLEQTPRDAVAVGDHAPEPMKPLPTAADIQRVGRRVIPEPSETPDAPWVEPQLFGNVMRAFPRVNFEALCVGEYLFRNWVGRGPEYEPRGDHASAADQRTQPRHFVLAEPVIFHTGDDIKPSFGSNGLIAGFDRVTSDGEHFPLPGLMQHNEPLDGRTKMPISCNSIQFWYSWSFAEAGREEDADDNEEGA
jgi:hypothetical protein